MSVEESDGMDLFDIEYTEFRPDNDLDWLVWHFWEMEVGKLPEDVFMHRIVPDAGFSIVVLPDKRLFALGPRTEAIEVPVHQGDFFAGVRFQPGSSQSAFDIATERSVGFAGPLESIAPNLASDLSAALVKPGERRSWILAVSEALKRMPLDASRADPILQAAIRQITTTQGDLHVNTLAGSLNVTVRRLQRLFKAHVGLSPKQVIRLQRFRSSATNLVIDAPVSWAQVAAERGFSDQSHLIREFTELGGTNPTRLFDQIGKIRHRGLEAGTE